MRLGPVVQKMDMTIHRISIGEPTCAIHLSNNWRLDCDPTENLRNV